MINLNASLFFLFRLIGKRKPFVFSFITYFLEKSWVSSLGFVLLYLKSGSFVISF